MPHIATTFNDWLKEQAQLCKFASERNGQCDDAFPDVVAAYTFVKTAVTSGVSGLGTYAKNLFKTRQVVKTIEKNATNLDRLPKLPGSKIADHHIFPQKYRPIFKKLGIDIDKYTVSLGNTTHLRGIHGKGNAGMPGGWNERWKEFFAKKLNPTAKEVYQFAGKLMDEYGINKEILHAYRK